MAKVKKTRIYQEPDFTGTSGYVMADGGANKPTGKISFKDFGKLLGSNPNIIVFQKDGNDNIVPYRQVSFDNIYQPPQLEETTFAWIYENGYYLMGNCAAYITWDYETYNGSPIFQMAGIYADLNTYQQYIEFTRFDTTDDNIVTEHSILVTQDGNGNTICTERKITVSGSNEYVPLSARECAIGDSNTATNYCTFAQGEDCSADSYSMAQGEYSKSRQYSLAQGFYTTANNYCFAQGYSNSAIDYSVAQGSNNTACSDSLSQGRGNTAKTRSVAEGNQNSAYNSSFAQGQSNSAWNISFAQGVSNTANDTGAFAQGISNRAGNYSFAQGEYCSAIDHSFAAGNKSYASGYGQAFGNNLEISGGMAIGSYNQTKSAAFVIGNGYWDWNNNTAVRSDLFVVSADGTVSAKKFIESDPALAITGGNYIDVTEDSQNNKLVIDLNSNFGNMIISLYGVLSAGAIPTSGRHILGVDDGVLTWLEVNQ